MSQSDGKHPNPEPQAPPDQASADPADDERRMSLGDLEEFGVEGVVARLRGDESAYEQPPSLPTRVARGRSPVLSVVIIGLGVYLLVTMFADFRYGLRMGGPRDLGHISEVVQDGKMPPGLHGQYVRFSGTPDVQHAARLTTSKGYVGYLRIIEGGGTLFAAVPRSKDEPVRTGEGGDFEGVFEGRLKPLGDDPASAWIDEYLRDQGVVRTVDVAPAVFWQAVPVDRHAKVETDVGPVTLGPDDRVRLVVNQPAARLQLGARSFADQAAAEQAVAALGYPYAALPEVSPKFHSFVANIPPAERERASERLNRGLEVPENNTNVDLGAAVLPAIVVVGGAAGELAVRDDSIVVPAGPEADAQLWKLDAGELVALSVGPEGLAVPKAWVEEVRVEQPVVIDPDGYVLKVDEKPADRRMVVLAWVVVLALVGLNVASLVQTLARRR